MLPPGPAAPTTLVELQIVGKRGLERNPLRRRLSAERGKNGTERRASFRTCKETGGTGRTACPSGSTGTLACVGCL